VEWPKKGKKNKMRDLNIKGRRLRRRYVKIIEESIVGKKE
jgi:hypothetical protein